MIALSQTLATTAIRRYNEDNSTYTYFVVALFLYLVLAVSLYYLFKTEQMWYTTMIWTAMSIIFVIIADMYILGTKISPTQIAGSIVILIGLMMLALPPSYSQSMKTGDDISWEDSAYVIG